MVDFSFYKSLYEREQDIRIAYDSRIEYTIALTIAISTADAFLCNWASTTVLFIPTCLVLLPLLTAHIATICFTYGSLKFHYTDFPVDSLDSDVCNHLQQYKDTFPECSLEDLQKEKGIYILGMLERTYKKCASAYYKENIRRRKLHFLLNIISLLNAISIVVLYVLCFILQFLMGR